MCGVGRAGKWGRGAVGYPSGQREQTVNLPAYAFEGSNPSPTIGVRFDVEDRGEQGNAGVAQLVERKPSKLDVAGSSPVSRSGESPLGGGQLMCGAVRRAAAAVVAARGFGGTRSGGV